MKRMLILAFFFFVVVPHCFTQSARRALPIIDMHLHETFAASNGPPLTGICASLQEVPYHDPSKTWMETITQWLKKPQCKKAVWGPSNDKELKEQTLAVLKRRNVYAVTSGHFVEEYVKDGAQRIIPSLAFSFGGDLSPENVRELLSTGKYRVFGEIGIQYNGVSTSDCVFEPFPNIAKELDIPVGIHFGPGLPGAPYLPGSGNYRARLHSPLVLEDALVRHPKLRVYLMHAGRLIIDDLIALLWTHPQVDVDVGVICYAIPRTEFYSYRKRIVMAGFGKRVMFGSDQMNWPEAIELGIEAIETVEFFLMIRREIFFTTTLYGSCD